ncbi:MAG: hypothetical protein M1522_02415 [Actinobacteria bacterium]|jgi:hypothetical protein|nr:hypothetical protein [Actinomycetota bacterium]
MSKDTGNSALDATLSRLWAWATGGDPDVPGTQHRYHARCPFCAEDSHEIARALLAVVDAAARLRSTAEECDGWDDLQASLRALEGRA